MNNILKAPFPYFGGKSSVAGAVWERFGNTPNFIEPFFGSGAVLLGRPGKPGTETINDRDGMVSNFFRSLQSDPDAVAKYADQPVNECDLSARHLWLVGRREDMTQRLMADPDYYDAKAAGWWVWGLCCWIGSGWCSGSGPWRNVDGRFVDSRLHPEIAIEQGVKRQLPHLGDAGRGVNRKRPHLAGAGKGVMRKTDRSDLAEYMNTLAERLRRVRVCCGDWSRICGPTVTEKNGLTAVFLDPPYSHAERADDLYALDEDCGAAVREWAIENGDNPLLRIAICSYGEYAMPANWERYAWKAAGGYGRQSDGRGRENAAREVVWFSPKCLKPAGGLFASDNAQKGMVAA